MSATGLWPAATLSVTVNVPVRAPLAAGANVTKIVQLFGGESDTGQLLLWKKPAEFAPTIEMPLMIRGVCPALVSCTGRVVLLPTGSVPKANLAGLNCATGSITLPVRMMCCGLPTALSVTFSVAVRVPRALPRKVTAIVQLLPAFKGDWQWLTNE